MAGTGRRPDGVVGVFLGGEMAWKVETARETVEEAYVRGWTSTSGA